MPSTPARRQRGLRRRHPRHVACDRAGGPPTLRQMSDLADDQSMPRVKPRIIAATALVSGVTPRRTWPKMNSGSVDEPGPGHERRDDVVVEAERERQQEPATIAGRSMREGDLAERPPRRREQVGARLDQGPVHARQPRADQQQDEADVEQHVGRDDRGVAELELDPRSDSIRSKPVAKRTRVARAMTISGTMMLMYVSASNDRRSRLPTRCSPSAAIVPKSVARIGVRDRPR